MYIIYQIGNYDLRWAVNNQAVVAANSAPDAASLLEEHIRNDPGIKVSV